MLWKYLYSLNFKKFLVVKMEVSRRDFLKLSFGTMSALAASTTAAQILLPGETYYTGKKIEPDAWKKGVCRYCGTGCGVKVGIKDNKMVAIKGNEEYPVNKGTLCLKGLTLLHVQHSDERALDPYVKKDGTFSKISMDDALNTIAEKINATVAEHGKDSVALYVGAQIFTEEMYVANKLFKGIIGTNNVEANARLCMASAVTGFLTTFGSDEPAGGYSDIEEGDVFFITGSNLAEQHPIVFGRVLERKSKNPNFKLIVVDPRYTPTAAHADVWLPILPGADVALINSMCYVIFKEGMVDHDFVKKHTKFAEGGGAWGDEKELSVDEFELFLEDYAPEKVADLIGVDASKIYEAARLIGKSKKVVSLWTMGLNQRKWGTWANNLVYNLHLLTGNICKPGASPISMTGQPNACGGVREQGMLAHLLPGHRAVANAKHREEMENFWKIPKGSISGTPGPHTVAMFDKLGEDIKLIWIVCSNPAQSLPHLNKVFPKLEKAYVIVQDIFPPTRKGEFPNITGDFADLFIPSSFWIEKGGVFGNTERRSSLTEKMIDPPKGLLSDGEIFLEVAKRMGYADKFDYPDTESIWNEYREVTKGKDVDLYGATYENLLKFEGMQWPAPTVGEEGTDIRFVYPGDKYLKSLVDSGKLNLPEDNIYFYGKPDGRARIFKRPYYDSAEMPDKEYPFYLTTGRIVHHWHTGTMTMRVPWLKKMAKDAFVEIHEDDAKKKGIKNDDLVKVVSRRGEMVLPAKIVDLKKVNYVDSKDRVSIPRPGVIFMPFYDATKLINVLCIDAVDDMSKEPEYKVCAVKIEKL